MNKTERKAIEKLALSAYAVHLYEGLTVHQNYTLGEVIQYWRTAKDDPGGMCPNYLQTNENIFLLMNDYQHNVRILEELIAARVAEHITHGNQAGDERTRVEVAAEALPPVFVLRSFPDIQLRIVRTFSYVNDANEVQLVLDRVDGKGQFGKGTYAELRALVLR